MTKLRDLLILPETVSKGQFVVTLAEGIKHPEELLRDYAITPDLAAAFDKALGLSREALQNARSIGSYIHGSFGSGKSHFMAALSLTLAGDPTPWAKPELHATLAKHAWVKDAKLLRLHFHVVGAQTLEEKIFAEYLDFVQREHKDAPLPALFQDAALFENAAHVRKTLGDAPFFEQLNAGAPTADGGGWGTFRPAARWHAESFETALQSTDPQLRADLFSALVRTLFPAFIGQQSRYIGIDHGLAILSQHAAKLGYQGVVLFLDELILWLASRAADQTWLSAEATKVAKLVESQDTHRPIPIISFVARQRDISELVGDSMAGSNATNLRDSLKWWEGRFDTITLPDRNLPAIVAARVVKPKDTQARNQLAQAFSGLQRGARVSWATLLGEEWTAQDFQQVYPFSPALVQSLVALSHYLQRERTALKVLMEMLVQHMEDFELGHLVAVGDLFDVLAGGEDPMDGRMRDLFDSAKKLYNNELLPLIQDRNNTTTDATCQRKKDSHPIALGCANCPNKACRGDNRLVKTLLLAALVPEVQVLKRLTASRLVGLNHGTLEAVIPGREAKDAVLRLRDYAAEIGKLQIGPEDDPTLAISLQGVDVKPLLDQERVQDSPGAQRRRLRELLFQSLQLNDTQMEMPYALEWRGTTRKGSVRFGNVREMTDSDLDVPTGDDFRVVIDYPFDEPQHRPSEDEERVRLYIDKGRSGRTVVWLPSFFSDKLKRDLGDLVVVEYVLNNEGQTLALLRPEDRARAVAELQSLCNQKKERLKRALSAAYGVASMQDGDLDEDNRVSQNFYLLREDLKVQPSLGADLKTSMDGAIGDMLAQWYPRHPKFSERLTTMKLTKALERFQAAVDADGQRIAVDRAERPLLDICFDAKVLAVTDTWASVQAAVLQEVDGRLAARGLVRPTVKQVADAFDTEGLLGLQRDLRDFYVLAYAAWGARQLRFDGLLLKDLRIGQLNVDAELEKPVLPSAAEFQAALGKAGTLFGIAVAGRALNPKNVNDFVEKLQNARNVAITQSAGAITNLLMQRAGFFQLDPEPARLRTASSAMLLLDEINDRDVVAVVQRLAAFEPATSATALAKHFTDAWKVSSALQERLQFDLFADVKALTDRADAAELLEQLRRVLEADQVQTELKTQIDQLAQKARLLLRKTPQPQKIEDSKSDDSTSKQDDSNITVPGKSGRACGTATTVQTEIVNALAALEAGGPDAELDIQWKIVRRER